jgi:hypothetical protein
MHARTLPAGVRRGAIVSAQTRDVLMLAISLSTAACSSCLYVLAVLYRARGLSVLRAHVFGLRRFAAVMAVRMLS